MRPSGERGAQPSATRCVRWSGDGTDCDTEELKSWAAEAAERYMVRKNSWRIARGSYEVLQKNDGDSVRREKFGKCLNSIRNMLQSHTLRCSIVVASGMPREGGCVIAV